MKVYNYGSDYAAQTKRDQERTKEAEAANQANKPMPIIESEVLQTPVEDAPNPIQDGAGAGEMAEPQTEEPSPEIPAETKKPKKKSQAQA